MMSDLNMNPYQDETGQNMVTANKHRRWDRVEETLEDLCIDFEYVHHGIKIGDFIFSPATYKWKRVGKTKWYRSAGLQAFLNKVGYI